MKRKRLSVLVVVVGIFMLLAGSASAGRRVLMLFEDGTGSSVASDSSGNGNDAVLTNMDVNTAWYTVTLPDTQPYSSVLYKRSRFWLDSGPGWDCGYWF